MLTIFVRKDLNMRKGKMAAQSAHAAMKLFLEVMSFSNNKLVLGEKENAAFSAFLASPTVEIKMIKDEAEFDNAADSSKPYAVIVDNGRTEFHGVPTKTCAAQGIFSEAVQHELYVPQTYGEGIKAKELFVFSKEIPLPKEVACELAVVSCLKMLYEQMTVNEQGLRQIDLNQESPLSSWISGAFGKIAVSTKLNSELDSLQESLEEQGFKTLSYEVKGNKCFVIAPQYPHVIDEYTRHLSLI